MNLSTLKLNNLLNAEQEYYKNVTTATINYDKLLAADPKVKQLNATLTALKK